ncbi:ABC transporter ATP-binding protein [Lentisphaerota bacterium ZTH]|nr:ABC transporter ATP-binding protein [Lentisphaerota bacterium]WET05234.1 ABC transporter ATP-binding protein [Lentisphaerota bacterium ZTH]
MKPVISIKNLCKEYMLGDTPVKVLKGVSMEVRNGELVSLMGQSGSGKSTLMNILGCLDKPTSGEYLLDGEDVTSMNGDQMAIVRNHKLGFVFQNFNLLPRTSAIENVAMPLIYTAAHLSKHEARKRAKAMLIKFGLESRMHHVPSQLSGGQQQRVAIARALINDPPLLLADEPTGNLDTATSREVLEMFQEINETHGTTILLVTHDNKVAESSRRVIHISDGCMHDGIYRKTEDA